MKRLWLAVCLISLARHGDGYGSGAPNSPNICKSMEPKHGVPPQNSQARYEVKALGPQNEDGRVKVEIRALRESFVGFMVEARPSPDSDAVGSFVQIPALAKTLDCFGVQKSAVTHTSNIEKNVIQMEWEAPYDLEGDVIFMSTFVLNASTFWTGVTSPPLQVSKRSAPASSASKGVEAVRAMHRGCGVTKYCVGSSNGCIASQNCSHLISAKSGRNQMIIELMGESTKYVAAGISEDEKMGGDVVFECVYDPRDEANPIKAFKSWNDFKSNYRIDGVSGFSLVSAKYEDDRIFCEISIDWKQKVNSLSFDIERNPYHVLYAAGDKATDKGLQYHSIRFSSRDKRSLLTAEAPEPKDEFYSDCNTLKSCFGHPSGCVQSQSCMAVASIFPKGDKLEFELQSKTGAYVAMGFSDDNKMGGDSVIECVQDEAGGGVKAYTSWNLPGEKKNTRDRIDQEVIEVLNSSFVDGKIYCKLSRKTVTYVQTKKFDLLRDNYYVLLAYGSSLKPNGVGFHDLGVAVTGQRARLSDVGAFSTASKLFIKLHGAFMIAAWIGTASIGMVLARHFKQTWVGRTFCGKDLWFVGHVFCMFSTWALTIVAFVLIFVEVGEWVSQSSQLHAILGCVTTILCFIQPIGALFRPAPNAPNRKYFNWIHWLFGNSAHIIGLITIYLSISLSKAELPEWMEYVLLAYVIVYIVTQIMFEIGGCVSEANKNSRINSFPMQEMDMRSSLYQWERKQEAPLSRYRRVILGLYMTLIVLLCAFLIILVVLSPFETYLTKLRKELNI